MKKSIISAMVILAAASLCWAAPKSDKSSGGKLKMDSSLFKTDAEFMQTFRNFSDAEVPAYAKGKVCHSPTFRRSYRSTCVCKGQS